MRLYEKIDIAKMINDGVSLDQLSKIFQDKVLLLQTNETFKSVREFIRHAKEKGITYSGRTFRLLWGSDKEITINPKTQYEVNFGNPEKVKFAVRDKD